MSFTSCYNIVSIESVEEIIKCGQCHKLLIYPIYDQICANVVCSCCVIDVAKTSPILDSDKINTEAECAKILINCTICKTNVRFGSFIDHIKDNHSDINIRLPERITHEKNDGTIVLSDTTKASNDEYDDSYFNDPEILNAIDDSFLILSESENIVKHDKPWFGHDLYVNSKLELNSIANITFNEDNIPIIVQEKKDQRSKWKKNTSDSSSSSSQRQYFMNRQHFFGPLTEEFIKNDDGTYGMAYTIDIYPNFLFIMPGAFVMKPQYTYSFYAYEMNKMINNKEVWRMMYNKNFPFKAQPSTWCHQTWDLLCVDLYKEYPLNYHKQSMAAHTFLPDEAFPSFHSQARTPPMSVIYMIYIRKHINPAIRYMMECMKDFKTFFFGNEIEELTTTWVPAKESLLALNVDGLFVLYNIFNKKGMPNIKYYYFKYLFFRPDEVIRIMDGVKTPLGNDMPSIITHGSEISVRDLFTCKSQTCEWPLPRFPLQFKEQIASYVFINFPSVPDTGIIIKGGMMMAIEKKMGNTDTCIYRSDLTNVISDWKRSSAMFKEDVVFDELKKDKVIKVFTKTNDNDKCITSRENYMRAQMLLISLRTLFDNFIQYQSDPSYMRQTTLDVHPFADPKYINNIPMQWAGEQELAAHIFMTKPLLFIGGEAGTGKTETMKRICNSFHKHEVLYASAVATTVVDVGYKKICRRSLTMHRCMIIHNMFCLNNDNPDQLRQTLFNCKRNHTRFLPRDDEKLTPDKMLFRGDKYICKPMHTCFTHCPFEKIRLVIIDEVGITDITNICRLLYLLSRCAAHDIKVVIGGDGGQLLSIAAGDSYRDILQILEPLSVVYRIDHRIIGDNALPRISSNRAVRACQPQNVFYGLKTTFADRQLGKYGRDDIPISQIKGYHFIEINKAASRETNPDMVEKALEPTLKYLLSKPEYLGHVAKYGVSDYIRIICPMHLHKDAISNWIKNNIFKPRALKTGRAFKDNIGYVDGEREEIFKGMKVIYTTNRYKHGLHNNLPYIVYRIQDVAFNSRKKKGQVENIQQSNAATTSSSDCDMGDLGDDIISDEGEMGVPAGGAPLSKKKLHEDIEFEFDKYGFDGSKPIDGHEDLPSTNVKEPFGMPNGSYGRRLIVVPISDVDDEGKIKTTINQHVIPWTHNHWFLVKSASASTIFSSQGGQCKVVIIVIPSFFKDRDTSNLLYVAVTRATHMVVIVSTEEILEQMIKNKAKERKTHYADYVYPKLHNYYDHDAFKVNDIPEELKQKLEEDQKSLEDLDKRIEIFRKQSLKDEKKKKKSAPVIDNTDTTLEDATSDLGGNVSLALLNLSKSFFASKSRNLRAAKRISRPEDEDMDMASSSVRFEPLKKKQTTSIEQHPPKATLPPPTKRELLEHNTKKKKAHRKVQR